MAIDRDRLQAFLREMRALQNSLSFDEHYEVFRAKIEDAISRARAFKELSRTQQRQFVESFFKPEHAKFATKIVRDYLEVLDIVNQIYEDLGIEIQRDFTKVRAIEQVNRTQLGDYEESAVKSIAKSLREGLARGDNFKEIRKALIQVGGKVTTYADVIARTQVKGYARVAKSEKARIAEVFIYEYVGIRRKTTRPFCRAMIGMSCHADTIRKLNNGQLTPILTYCGGWHCFHDWEPNPSAKAETKGATLQDAVHSGHRLVVFSTRSLESVIEEYDREQKGD